MQIDELAGNTVKITLNPSDMDGYRIKCEDISGDSRTSELALSRLISCLSEDHNLGLCGERLLVEAFPKSDGGCTLYISCIKGAPSVKNTSCRPPLMAVICEGELCVLARLCKALKTVADRVSLYADRDGKDYRLAIHLPQSRSSESRIGIIRHIVSEYRLPLYTDLSRMSDTEEYYTLLTDKATELLPDCF